MHIKMYIWIHNSKLKQYKKCPKTSKVCKQKIQMLPTKEDQYVLLRPSFI